MGLAFGIILLWLACAAFWVAFHPGQYKSPWDVVQEVVRAVTQGGVADVDPTTDADIYPQQPPVVPHADLSAFAGSWSGEATATFTTPGTGAPGGSSAVPGTSPITRNGVTVPPGAAGGGA